MALILDGKAVRDRRKTALAAKIAGLSVRPKLSIVQVGDNPESAVYIRQKISFAKEIGCDAEHVKFPQDSSEEEIAVKIRALNSDPAVTGIILQIPLPKHLSPVRIIDVIDPAKDVDGMTSSSVRALTDNLPGFVPATTRGILTLLDEHKIEIGGKKVVVVGRSALVGKPTALAFLNRDATVTVCHSKTADLSQETKAAVILVIAAGKAGLITQDHVRAGQIVIDVGINVSTGEKLEDEIAKRKLSGDVDYAAVSEIVAAISPVPGGVGPMTVLSLFENVVDAAEAMRR